MTLSRDASRSRSLEMRIVRIARTAVGAVCLVSALTLCILCFTTGNVQHSSRKGGRELRVTKISSPVSVRSEAFRIPKVVHQLANRVIDVDRTNLTVILENIQFEYDGGNQSRAPWMYTGNDDPFKKDLNSSSSMLAHTKIDWNGNGTGNGSCLSGGSGKISRGYLDPFNFHANITMKNLRSTKVELRNISLSQFNHINTVNRDRPWNVSGEAGDRREYIGGTLKVFDEENVFLSAGNIHWHQDMPYRYPVGEAQTNRLQLSAYFTAEINVFQSNDVWVRELDPRGTGYVLGVVTAASFGASQCFTANSYWITLRGFPDLEKSVITAPYAPSIYNDTSHSGAKAGVYRGSSATQVRVARTLGVWSSGATIGAVASSIGGVVGRMALSAASPSISMSAPGQGVARMLSTASFFARLGEIRGFHSEAMIEFAKSLKPFVAKFPFPSSGKGRSRGRRRSLARQARQDGKPEEEDDDDFTVSDEVFAGCAFYTSLILVGFMMLHTVVWLWTRKKAVSVKVRSQAWIIYLFSIAMSYVYSASVLNSAQYLRSHLGRGGGQAKFYAIAILQLVFVGIGFSIFIACIMVLAYRRVRKKDLKWVPRLEIPDPNVRQAAAIRGEYETNEKDPFHTLFECYYASMVGPRLWLAGIELFVTFVDSICTAIIWNEIVVLGILVSVYAILFVLFVTLAPHVDKFEGRIVVLLGTIDLTALVVEFMGAFGGYETAERMDYIALILGFVSMGIAILSSVYCDLIPTIVSAWGVIRQKLCEWKLIAKRGVSGDGGDDDESSEWSFLDGSWGRGAASSSRGGLSGETGCSSDAESAADRDLECNDNEVGHVGRSDGNDEEDDGGRWSGVVNLFCGLKCFGGESDQVRAMPLQLISADIDEEAQEIIDMEAGERYVKREFAGDGVGREKALWPKVGQTIYRVKVRSWR